MSISYYMTPKCIILCYIRLDYAALYYVIMYHNYHTTRCYAMLFHLVLIRFIQWLDIPLYVMSNRVILSQIN